MRHEARASSLPAGTKRQLREIPNPLDSEWRERLIMDKKRRQACSANSFSFSEEAWSRSSAKDFDLLSGWNERKKTGVSQWLYRWVLPVQLVFSLWLRLWVYLRLDRFSSCCSTSSVWPDFDRFLIAGQWKPQILSPILCWLVFPQGLLLALFFIVGWGRIRLDCLWAAKPTIEGL